MEFTKYQIKAVKGAALFAGESWVHAEILVDGKWIHPYFVNEEHLYWYEPDTTLYYSEKNVKEWLANALYQINDRLSRGYKLVDYNKFKEVIHRYHFPHEYVPGEIRLD